MVLLVHMVSDEAPRTPMVKAPLPLAYSPRMPWTQSTTATTSTWVLPVGVGFLRGERRRWGLSNALNLLGANIVATHHAMEKSQGNMSLVLLWGREGWLFYVSALESQRHCSASCLGHCALGEVLCSAACIYADPGCLPSTGQWAAYAQSALRRLQRHDGHGAMPRRKSGDIGAQAERVRWAPVLLPSSCASWRRLRPCKKRRVALGSSRASCAASINAR